MDPFIQVVDQFLEKADNLVQTTDTVLLNPRQSRRFVRQVIQTAPGISMARCEFMEAQKEDVNKINIPQRILQAWGGEGTVYSGNDKVTSQTIELVAQQMIYGYPISWEAERNNIEDAIRTSIDKGTPFGVGELAATIQAMATMQIGPDLNTAAWQGNTVANVTQGTTFLTDTTAGPLHNATLTTVGNITVTAAVAVDWTKWPSTGVINVESESVAYDGLVPVGVPTSSQTAIFTLIDRGHFGSTAVVHNSSTSVVVPSPKDAVFLQQGWLSYLNTNIVDALNTASTITTNLANTLPTKELFNAMLRALPKRYKSNLPFAINEAIRKDDFTANQDLHQISPIYWWMSADNYLAWQEYMGDRNTAAGDLAILGVGDRTVYNIPIVIDTAIPNGNIVLGGPRNLLIGVQYRNVRWSVDRTSKVVTTAHESWYQADLSAAFQVEEPAAMVVARNVTQQ